MIRFSNEGVVAAMTTIIIFLPTAAEQFNIHSLPQVNVYDRGGRLVGTVLGVDFEKAKSYVVQAKSNS
jgi:hypothetical protein